MGCFIKITEDWISLLLSELGVKPKTNTTLFCNNIVATQVVANLIFHARTKHVEVAYHFICDFFQVRHIQSSAQLADIFTKSLSPELFDSFRSKLM